MLKPCAHLRTAFTLSRLIDQTLTFLSIYGHSCSSLSPSLSIGRMVDCCISAPCYTTSLNSYTLALGLPWGSDSKESACSAGDPGSPWVGKISCQRKWQPNPVFLPGESHGRGSLAGHSPWGSQRRGHDWATNPFTFTPLSVSPALLQVIAFFFPRSLWTLPCDSLWLVRGIRKHDADRRQVSPCTLELVFLEDSLLEVTCHVVEKLGSELLNNKRPRGWGMAGHLGHSSPYPHSSWMQPHEWTQLRLVEQRTSQLNPVFLQNCKK